jgi:hypothetical protein
VLNRADDIEIHFPILSENLRASKASERGRVPPAVRAASLGPLEERPTWRLDQYERWELRRLDQDSNRSRCPRRFRDEAAPLERDDHVMH